MRVGLDARMIDWSGIGRYTENLIEGFKEFGTDIKPILFCNENNAGKVLSNFAFEKHYLNIGVFSLNAPIKLANKLKQYKMEVYHSPHFVVPAGRTKYPIVVTIHDLIPLIIKETMPNALYRHYYYMLNQIACRKAAKIIAPSQSTKNDIMRMLGVTREKIEVVYECSHGQFRKTSNQQVKKVKEKFAIKGNYIFALGNQKPNKGIEFLIEAFYKLVSSYSFSHELILTGLPSAKFKGVVKRITKYGLGDKVKFIGKPLDEELVALYNGASAFVFPSLYEGFGLPLLEAMACETPVVASNRSSIPEVVRDAALTVDPSNIEELVNAIAKVIEDRDLRLKLIERGLERTKDFSLEKCVKGTIAVYKKALEKI